ncbi:hypothetical protein SAMN02910263_03967 [Butyrivibrio sp. INlla16]|nr:hypothetical protein SAMN02910263_03967 [Butyrivibrio sp. INlla16]
MRVIETINNRHSYRGKYKPDTVPREDLMRPSGGRCRGRARGSQEEGVFRKSLV